LANASYHLKLACGALARIIYLTGEAWHSTSVLYNQYKSIILKDTKPLSYRRVSELLTELENTGLVISQTSSHGRHGYGTQYKLVVSPEMVGMAAFPEWWKGIVKAKLEHEYAQNYKGLSFGRKPGAFDGLLKTMSENNKLAWKKYLGLDQ
jgi:cell division control protein 6